MTVIYDKFVRVEYVASSGESQEFILIPARSHYVDGVVERTFTEITGLPDTCISYYTVDELYDADGNIVTELADVGIEDEKVVSPRP